MGLIDLLLNLFKGKNPSELIDEVQEKLQDGSLDDVLQKFGVDGAQLGSVAGGVMSIIEIAKKAFGARVSTEEEESDDEEAEEADDDFEDVETEEEEETEEETEE